MELLCKFPICETALSTCAFLLEFSLLLPPDPNRVGETLLRPSSLITWKIHTMVIIRNHRIVAIGKQPNKGTESCETCWGKKSNLKGLSNFHKNWALEICPFWLEIWMAYLQNSCFFNCPKIRVICSESSKNIKLILLILTDDWIFDLKVSALRIRQYRTVKKDPLGFFNLARIKWGFDGNIRSFLRFKFRLKGKTTFAVDGVGSRTIKARGSSSPWSASILSLDKFGGSVRRETCPYVIFKAENRSALRGHANDRSEPKLQLSSLIKSKQRNPEISAHQISWL